MKKNNYITIVIIFFMSFTTFSLQSMENNDEVLSQKNSMEQLEECKQEFKNLFSINNPVGTTNFTLQKNIVIAKLNDFLQKHLKKHKSHLDSPQNSRAKSTK